MTYCLKSLIYILFLFICAVPAFDFGWITDLKGENTGHTTCQFITLPNSSTGLSRGQSSVSGAMDASDIPNFIATTAYTDRNKFSVAHLEWYMGLRKEYIGGIFPLIDIGTLGFSTQVFTPGKIGHARTVDESPSSPSYYEYMLGVSFARHFLNRKLSTGCAFSFIESHIDKDIGRGFSVSADIQYSPLQLISARLYLLNIGSGVKYNATAEDLPTEGGLSFQFFPLRDKFIEKTGLALNAGAGVRKIADQPVIAGLSAEGKLKDIFSVQVGYEYPYGQEHSIEGLSAGTGLHVGNFSINGGWKYGSRIFGSVWALNASLQLEEILPKSAEDYLSLAQKHYAKKRFLQAAKISKKALALDPNLWKAHALLSKTQSEILREKNLEIGIIYTGNISGTFTLPLDPGTPGGLSRIATIVKTLKQQFPVNLSVEAGNLVSKTSHKLHNSIAGFFLNYMQYDVIAYGNQEINRDISDYYKDIAITPKKLVCLNSLYPLSLNVQSFIVEKDKYRFFITSLVNESLIDSQFKAHFSSLQQKVNPVSQDGRKCDLRIAIIHDEWKNISKSMDLFSEFDIVLCGGLSQPFQVPLKIGSTFFISAGKNGEYVGNLILRFDADRKLNSVENKLYPVLSEVQPDTVISGKVDEISAKIELVNQGITDDMIISAKSQGAFPFLSDRNGKEQVFLKIAAQNAEFPETYRSINCSKPSVSYKAGKMACIIQNDTCSMLHTLNLNGSGKRISVRNLNITETAISPDGNWVYFAASPCGQKKTDIYRQKMAGGPFFPVVQNDSSNENDISFSERDDLIAFCSDRTGQYQVYLTNHNGEKPVAITNSKADHVYPQFSPDGNLIAYLSDSTNFGGKLDIWVYSRKDKVHRQITQYSNVKEFSWFPDSKTIVFSNGNNRTFELQKVNISAYRFSSLIAKNSIQEYSERNPVCINFKDTLKIAYTREYLNGMRKIYWVNADGTNDQCVVNSKGNDWLPVYRK